MLPEIPIKVAVSSAPIGTPRVFPRFPLRMQWWQRDVAADLPVMAAAREFSAGALAPEAFDHRELCKSADTGVFRPCLALFDFNPHEMAVRLFAKRYSDPRPFGLSGNTP
jgi:hypothetical protein